MPDTDDKTIPGPITGKGDSAGSTSVRPETARSVSTLDLDRLNRLITHLAGSEFRIVMLEGEALNNLDEGTLSAMADCYARLAREKWFENWSQDSAREELRQYFQSADNRINLVSLVYKGNEVIGLCLAFVFSAHQPGNLAAHFSSTRLSNKSNLEPTLEWISQAGGKEKLVSIRELGVLQHYEKIRAPLLCAPVYASALELDCKYIFLRTPVNNEALKWSMGIGFIPEQYFVVHDMLLMLGDLENTVRDYEFRILDYFAAQLSLVLDEDRNFEAIMHKTEMDHSEKMKVMQGLSANIAHEMRTPLSGVRASMEGLDHYLPQLLEVYKKALGSGEPVPHIQEDRLNVLEQTPERIALMIDQANSVIDMLLMNLREHSVDRRQFSVYSAADCINQALDRYPFKRGEREKIRFEMEEDFYFKGIDSLFVFVIFNLLKNALYSINSVLKGDITIAVEQGATKNQVRFRDTGGGIDASILEKIFDSFFTTREDGTGVGLSYCKRTIQSFGGNIQCHSEPGSYTEFVISLPQI